MGKGVFCFKEIKRGGSTPVSTLLRKSVRYFIMIVLLIVKKFSKLNLAPYPTYKMEINLDEIILRFARLHPRTMELANNLSE